MAARGAKRQWTLERLARLRRWRRMQSVITVGIVVLGPILALATYLILRPLDQGVASNTLRFVLLGDFIYILAVAALVLSGVTRMIRRAGRNRRGRGSTCG